MKPSRWLYTLTLRLRSLFGRQVVDRELQEELQYHVERKTEDYLRRGMSAQEARRTALMELGGLEQAKEKCRDTRKINWIQDFVADLRYGVRLLRKVPGFATVAVLTLALGIGATTALFSVVNGVLLNPLPYPDPGRLIEAAAKSPPFSESSIAYPNFLDWVSRNHTFETLAAYRPNNFNLTGLGQAQQVKAMQVSASFFPLLGVKPLIGRNFTTDEDKRGAAPVAMLSYGFWKNKFGGSPEILGKTLTLDGAGYTVIGVIPANFYFCCQATNFRLGDIYVPIGSWNNVELYDRGGHMGTYAVGRLRQGVSLAQAHADMDRVSHDLAVAYPDSDSKEGVWLAPLKERMVRDVRPMLLVLLAAVGFVLLIASVNVANLLLARTTGREREFSIRAAIGAGRGRLVRQLLTESLLLAIAGAGLGLLLASWGTQAALRVLPEALPRANDVRLDPRVLFFTMAVALLAGVLAGLAPALKTSHLDLHEALKEGGRGASGERHRAQGIFVVLEMAMALVLLIGAGLAIRSLVQLWRVNPGFNPRNVLTFSVAMPPSTAKEKPDKIRTNLRQLTAAIAAIPGVQSVSLTDGAQPMYGDDEWQFWLDGQPKPPTQSQMPRTLVYMVSPDYLKVMQIPLLRGRFPAAQDDSNSPFVGAIDENFARQYFPNQDPIGKRLHIPDLHQPLEIVGVVGHVNQWGLAGDATGPVEIQLYTLTQQSPAEWLPSMSHVHAFVVRTPTPLFPGVDAIRQAISAVNGMQVAYAFKPMEEIIADSLASQRFAMALLSVFAAIALLLASIGIYGVIAHVAGQRTHEIGVRLALGAQQADVLRLFLGQGARLVLIGEAVGVAAAAVLTRLMTRLLFGVSAVDPLTFVSVAILLCAVALAACYVPARRAMRVDPILALRNE
jgi:predicted permease